jgi:glycine cleavage system transcriptional repressor
MPGRQWFAIAAIGRDRPGIVADLSEFVYACGCNLEDASMTMLGSEFATLMSVSGIGGQLTEELSNAARKLEREKRLTIFIQPLEEQSDRATADARKFSLSAQGVDKAGIVSGVARTLAERGVLITDLRGRVSPMPQTGTPLYTLSLRMSIPRSVDVDALRDDLGRVGEKLDVEVSLREGD